MNNSQAPDGDERAVFGRLLSSTDRRNFLKWSGTAAATALLIACDQSPTETNGAPVPSEAQTQTAAGRVRINVGTDLGILNFAYALEQLEAAFYTKVVANFYDGATSVEQDILRDIKKHEVVHREFFQAALAGAAIPNLAVDFSTVNFDSRESVLVAAKVFEDTGVGAYNGAAQFLRNGDYLEVAGKIVSVEARHASTIRDVLGRSFAPKAFDDALTFEQALRRAAPFIATDIALTHSPTAGQVARRNAGDEEMNS